MAGPSLEQYIKNARNEPMRMFAAAALAGGAKSVREFAAMVSRDHKGVLAHLNASALSSGITEEYARALRIDLDHKSSRAALRKERVKMGAGRLTASDLFYYGFLLLRLVAVEDRSRDFVEATECAGAAIDRAELSNQRRALHPFAQAYIGVSPGKDLWSAGVTALQALGVPQLEVRPEGDKDFLLIFQALRSLGLDSQGQRAVLDLIRDLLTRDSDVVRRNYSVLQGSFWYALTGLDGEERYQRAAVLLAGPPADADVQ